MQISNLKPKTKQKKAKRVGRAGSRGKTSGRGTKGQNARAGHKKRPEFREMIKKIPKLRGRGKNIFTPVTPKAVPLSLSALDVVYLDQEVVNLTTLREKKLISKNDKRVKILSDGEITKPLKLEGILVSETAREKISKAGGSVS